MKDVRATPTAHHVKRRAFVHKELDTCTHVFLRVDRARGPLESPYEGPYQILRRVSDSLFQIRLREEAVNIPIERLKPAFTETLAECETAWDDSDRLDKPSTSRPDQPRTYSRKQVKFRA
ncbi:hypothetical protein X777_05691 [Ooceraea biroi]|uniref:Uncharacterized protein n=1 Tax=Ooceraea biroi TaxID=2015173 RepID=A0A026WEQ3_OOCBI|nr:hypothetical protein X777_05691 [Ooceraea biroi]